MRCRPALNHDITGNPNFERVSDSCGYSISGVAGGKGILRAVDPDAYRRRIFAPSVLSVLTDGAR